MVTWGGSAVSVKVFLSTRGQRRPATGAPPRARPLKSPPKEHLSPFQIKRPAAKRSAPPYAHGARGGRSPNEEGSPAPPLCLGIGNAFFYRLDPLFFPFSDKTRPRNGRKQRSRTEHRRHAGEREAPPPARKRAPLGSKPGTLQEHREVRGGKACAHTVREGRAPQRTSHPPRLGEKRVAKQNNEPSDARQDNPTAA